MSIYCLPTIQCKLLFPYSHWFTEAATNSLRWALSTLISLKTTSIFCIHGEYLEFYLFFLKCIANATATAGLTPTDLLKFSQTPLKEALSTLTLHSLNTIIITSTFKETPRNTMTGNDYLEKNHYKVPLKGDGDPLFTAPLLKDLNMVNKFVLFFWLISGQTIISNKVFTRF